MKETKNIIVAVVGVGLDTYWPQFDGLYDRLMGYQEMIVEKLKAPKVDIINAGIVDSVEKSIATAESLSTKGISLLFVYISTYALSSTVLPLVSRIKVPVVILNVQPTAAIDYQHINSLGDRGKMTGEWLANCQACSVPEFASVFNKAGIKYDIVTGYLHDEHFWKESSEWIKAACAVEGMRANRVGILGHYYCGMLDVYSDITQEQIVFGSHFEMLEMAELRALRSAVTDKEMNGKIEEFKRLFDVSPECEQYELERAAKTSVALNRLADVHRLGSMAYYYEGYHGDDLENIVTSVIAGNTLLTSQGIPVAGECEVKNVMAMKLMDLLGAGGSFSEFYAMDFNDDIVMLGHDGPAHFAIAEGRVGLVPLPVYHGKPGKGLSIQMTVKHGPVTLLSVCEGRDGIFLLTAEGESVEGPTLQIGNTNSRYRFPCGVRNFIERWSKAGPSHHCAIGIGHVADTLQKAAFLLEIPIVRI